MNLPISGFLGSEVELKGELSFDGRFQIEGYFSGRIFSEGLLIVGEQARIEGEIDVRQAIVAGDISGKVWIRDRLKVHPGARISGELHVAKIEVSRGAKIEAKVSRLPRSW